MINVNTKLNGSAKQVAWAEDIRADIVKHINEQLADMESRLSADKFAEFEANYNNLLVPAIEGIKEARWYIDNKHVRYYDPEKTVKFVVACVMGR